MSTAAFKQDVNLQVGLPWPIICKLAVKACCLGVSLNDVCEMVIADAVKQRRPAAQGRGAGDL